MKKSLKTFVRAISPFTSRKTKQPIAEEDDSSSVMDWDLSNVDIKQALKMFYKKYNPEKSFIVNDILSKYVGDETLLLQQLCE